MKRRNEMHAERVLRFLVKEFWIEFLLSTWHARRVRSQHTGRVRSRHEGRWRAHERALTHRGAVLLICLCLGVLMLACDEARKAEPAEKAPDYFKVDASTAGTITGKVFYSGKKLPPKKVDMEQDPQCAKLHQQAVYDEVIATSGAKDKEQAASLANVFVYIKAGLEDKKFEAAADPVVIDQKGCWFGPRVLGLQVGQTLKITNSDPVTHNIHPLAQVNREWNQSQAPGAEAFTRKFTQPEVMIRVKCNIHNWMHAWVGVVPHPYFAVTGADGSFQIRNVPPGNYTIEVWHEELGRQELSVTLTASGQSESIFTYKGVVHDATPHPETMKSS